MLQNEPLTEQVIPPGQARITPEELNRAVAAIERRQEAEAQRLAGTIAIDEAVSQLHLNATSEDIWREVQSQRDAEARQAAAAQVETKPEQSPQTQFDPPQARAQPMAASRSRRKAWKGLFAPAIVLWVLYSTGIIPHIGHHAELTPPALTATAVQVPDGTQFYCDSSGLTQISEGKPLSQVHVSVTQDFGNSWTLVKMAGHVYLRAYTLPLTSVQAVQGQPLVLYNDDNSGALEGEKTAQTTLRVDNTPLGISGGDADYTQVTVPNFQPDQFTTTSGWR